MYSETYAYMHEKTMFRHVLSNIICHSTMLGTLLPGDARVLKGSTFISWVLHGNRNEEMSAAHNITDQPHKRDGEQSRPSTEEYAARYLLGKDQKGGKATLSVTRSAHLDENA